MPIKNLDNSNNQKISNLIENIKNSEARKLIYYWEEEKSDPKFAPNFEDLYLDQRLIESLNKLGIKKLYTFQYDTIKKIIDKKNVKHVMINASVSSGKTEAFMIPIISKCLERREKCTAILIYPTKALAIDQMRRLNKLVSDLDIKVSKFDGDTPKEKRIEILTKNIPDILITNPDMLHKNFRDTNFQSLLSSIKYIVFDEVHNYSGIFGSSVLYVIKRLKRFVKKPQFICSSATIGNPKFLTQILFGLEFEIIKSEKILKEKRRHIMLKPKNHSKYSEAIYLTKALIQNLGIKTLIFCEGHLSCELLKKIADFQGVEMGIHRAGIAPKIRTDVENKFKSDKYQCVVSTPTLELGIDIGDLGAIINLSIPPTFNRYLQRIGRAGRRYEQSLDFILIGDDPISNYYYNSPKEYYNSVPDPIYIDEDNPVIIKQQLISLCVDKPIGPEDLIKLRAEEKNILKVLIEEGFIQFWNKIFLIPTDLGYNLFNNISLRNSGETIEIKCDKKILGNRAKQLAIKELHQDAIYMSAGSDYKVISFNLKKNEVIVSKLNKRLNYYTKALYNSNISDFKPIETKNIHGIKLFYGNGKINEIVNGYLIKDLSKNKVIVKKTLDNPLNYSFHTKMIFFKIPLVDENMKLKTKIKTFHAIEHVLIQAGISLTGAAITELGGVAFPDGTIFIHDGIPGGTGLCKLLFDRFYNVIHRAIEILENCTCEEDGCPKCIFSHYCGSNNENLSRTSALKALKDLITGKGPMFNSNIKSKI